MDKYQRYPSLKIYDQLNIPYVLLGQAYSYDGPLWTGVNMMLMISDGYGDAGFFHEIGHYLAATEEQRIHPDFKLGRQINGGGSLFTSSATPHLYDPEKRNAGNRPHGFNAGWGEDTIPTSVAHEQEGIACDFLGIYEPMCGIWPWKRRDRDGLAMNHAAGDFGAFDYPNDNVEERAERLYDRLVVQINPRLRKKTVVDYCVYYFTPEPD